MPGSCLASLPSSADSCGTLPGAGVGLEKSCFSLLHLSLQSLGWPRPERQLRTAKLPWGWGSAVPAPPQKSAVGIATSLVWAVTFLPCRTLSPGRWLLLLELLLIPMPQAAPGSTTPPHEPFPSLLSSRAGLVEANPPPRAPSSSQSLISPGKAASPRTPSPRSPSGRDKRRAPPAKPVPTCSTRSHVRRGGSLSLCSPHARNSYRPQPGAGAPRGRWEPQPRRGAAPWEPRPDPGTRPAPGAAGFHLQDTAAEMKFRSKTIRPFSGGMGNEALRVNPRPAAIFWDAGHCCREQMENKWVAEVGRSGFAWRKVRIALM